MDSPLVGALLTALGAVLSVLYGLHVRNFSEYKKTQGEVKKAHEDTHAHLASEINRAGVDMLVALRREMDSMKGETVGSFSGNTKALAELSSELSKKSEAWERKDKEFWEELKILREDDAKLKLTLARHYMTKPEVHEKIVASNELLIHQLNAISMKLGVATIPTQFAAVRSGDLNDD